MAIVVTDNMRGAGYLATTMALFTLGDACTKIVGTDIPLLQYLFLRGLLASILIALFAWRTQALRFNLPRKDWALLLMRSGAEMVAVYFFLSALLRMEIANAIAVLQVLPLTVALGATLFFKEPMGKWRVLAILIGFCGTLLIVRPGPSGFSTESIYVLITVAFVTVRDLSARRMSAAVPSLMGALVMALVVTTVSGIAILPDQWTPVSNRTGGLIVLAGFLIAGGYLFSVMSMRVGEITLIAPFRYTSLIFALIFGLLIFGDWPDNLTLLGAAIVIGSGLFTLYRETRAKRRQLKAART